MFAQPVHAMQRVELVIAVGDQLGEPLDAAERVGAAVESIAQTDQGTALWVGSALVAASKVRIIP